MRLFFVRCVSNLDPPNQDKTELLELLEEIIWQTPAVFGDLARAKSYAEINASTFVDELTKELYAPDEAMSPEVADKTVVWRKQIDLHVGRLPHYTDVEWFAVVHEVELSEET